LRMHSTSSGMKNKLSCFLALLASSTPQIALAHQPARALTADLTVSVFNDADVPQPVLAEARIRANLVLRRAGVSVLWLDCGTPANRPLNSECSALSFPQHLSVRLVSTPSGGTQDTFGQSFQNAAGEGNYAVVYFRVLTALKSAEGMRTGDLLGFVVAHELGHLLLGRDSHSPTGLMSPVWQLEEMHQAARGNLFFTEQQQDLIRARYLAALSKKQNERIQADSGK